MHDKILSIRVHIVNAGVAGTVIFPIVASVFLLLAKVKQLSIDLWLSESHLLYFLNVWIFYPKVMDGNLFSSSVFLNFISAISTASSVVAAVAIIFSIPSFLFGTSHEDISRRSKAIKNLRTSSTAGLITILVLLSIFCVWIIYKMLCGSLLINDTGPLFLPVKIWLFSSTIYLMGVVAIVCASIFIKIGKNSND